MNRLSCYFEKISDTAVGLFLLFFGLILTVISFTIIPVIGLVVAIPVLFLAVSFLGAVRTGMRHGGEDHGPGPARPQR